MPKTEEPIVFYELEKKEITHDFFVTAAFRNCSICATTIDSMGGPGWGSICVDCAKAIFEGPYALRKRLETIYESD